MNSSLKQELIDKIAATEDEELLNILKEDIDVYEKTSIENDFSELSSEDKKDLIELINEPDDYETESLEEFKKATDKWLTK